MRLLEIVPEKRITADMALEHPFLKSNNKIGIINKQEISDDVYNIEADEGHASKLKMSANHE